MSLTVQTIPFQAEPVVYADLSLRRWVSRPISRWVRRDICAYILAPFAWLPQTVTPTSFQVARIHRRRLKDTIHVDWRSDLISILAELGTSAPQLHQHPDAAALIARPEHFVQPAFDRGSADPAIALALSGRLQEQQQHLVRPGCMPPDLRRLLAEQAAARLAPELELIAPDPRVHVSTPSTPSFPGQSAVAVRPAAGNDDGESGGEPGSRISSATAKASEWHEVDDWRETLARCFAHRVLAFHLYTQTDAIRAALHLALDALLGPYAALGANEAGTARHWSLGTATVEVVEHTLGAEGARLHLGNTGTRRERGQRALSERAEQVARRVRIDADGGVPGAVGAALIEIGPPQAYRAALDTDPYHALRLGCAYAGWVAQFITTEV